MPSKINSDLWLCLTYCWLLIVRKMNSALQSTVQSTEYSRCFCKGACRHRQTQTCVTFCALGLELAGRGAVSCSDIVFHATVVVVVVVVAAAAVVVVVVRVSSAALLHPLASKWEFGLCQVQGGTTTSVPAWADMPLRNSSPMSSKEKTFANTELL